MQGGGDLRAELRDECLRQEFFYSLKEAHSTPSVRAAVEGIALCAEA